MNYFTVPKSTAVFYGKYITPLQDAIEYIIAQVDMISEECVKELGRDPIENIKYRIKSPESMSEKLKNHGFEITAENAVKKVYDAAGVRIVTSFLEDVDIVISLIKNIKGIRVVEEKDYITYPKRNGYRSYHVICSVPFNSEAIFVEMQIRTIAMDTWASVEHRMKYKKIVVDEKMIVAELKRCADELASVDLSLQRLSKIISGGMENEDIVCGGREGNVRRSC